MAFNWDAILVNDELSEVPFDEIAKGAPLFVLKGKQDLKMI